MSLDYPHFLARAAGVLAAEGAQPVSLELAARLQHGAPGWDQVFLVSNPGAVTIYAFTRLDASVEQIRARLDGLARVMSGLNITGAPLELVSVIASDHPLDRKQLGVISRLVPANYYPGLRPQAVAVDLHSEEVAGGSRLRRPGYVDAIQRSIRGEAEVLPADAPGVEALRIAHVERMRDFYRLMSVRQPVVTYALIAINVIIFAVMSMHGDPSSDGTLRDAGALSPRLIEEGQWWRLFTAIFLHASVTHILFNMTSLFAIGTLAERLYGSARFLAIYIGAGLIGSLSSFAFALMSGNLDILGVGASGAIFGVAGALLTVRFQPSDVIPKQLRDRVTTSLLPLVGLSLLLSYLTPHVDNSAHIGGLLGGMALSFVFPLTRRLSAAR